RRVIGPLREIDPIAVAIRVAQGGARDAGRVSVDEIRAVCEALTDERHALLEARSLIAAAKEAAAALHEQRQARFTIREPSADVRVRKALEALSQQFESQEQADG
ncbi:hypothetical protein, partial [Methylosinus sp. Sm6]|uniref:hypothetical protein n=1 Tax=Methylosinus sp. Sm6 TaxID=2866948 RepID=UPI001C990DAF